MAIAGTLKYKTELDTSGVKKSGSTVKSIIAGLGITKMISKAMSTISNSLDGAISRFDTLNNFPKVMSNLGISAKDSEKAIKKMSDKLSGLPTTLDQGAMAVQRFTSKNGDVAKSTDIFLALNNAILAGGASTEIQAQALEQMSQAYAKGKPDMMEWRSIMTAMPAQLNQVADAMGYGKNGADKLGEALRKGDVSMDKFMDTIIKLNKNGSKNFKSFEEQAKNSTAGIGTAIAVAKTQIVKGLTTIISGIDKSLKKSGTSINKIIAEIGNKLRKVLESIGKALEKVDFVAIFNVFKKLLPVIVSVTTAWIAYNVAIKATALIGIVSTIASTASAFIKLIPSIKSAKDAMTLLNMTFNVNPIVAVTTAIVALGTALALMSNKKKELTEEEKKYKEKIDEQNEAIENSTEKVNDYKNSLETLQEQKQNTIDAGMTEMSYYEDLADELDGLVDKNGKIKKGYEERASFITSELSKATGIEIKATNGIIKNYDKLQKKIAEVIEQKKAKIILDAQEDLYREAIEKQISATKELRKIKTEINNEKKIEKNLNKELEEEEKEYEKAKKEMRTKDKLRHYNRIKELEKEIATSNERTKELEKNYNTQKDTIKEYAYNIEQYEGNLAKFHAKNYKEMTNVDWEYEKEYEKSSDAKKAKMQDEIANTEEYIEILQEMQDKNYSKEREKTIKNEQKKLKELKNNLKKYQDSTSEGLGTIEDEWNNHYKKLISDATGKKIEFKKLGNGQIQMYVDGVKNGKPKSKKEMQSLVTEAIDQIKSGQTGAKTAGENLIDGVKQGVSNKNKQNSVFTTINTFGARMLNTLKASLKEKSPSKATREMGIFLLEGLEQGIDKEENNALKQISEFGNNVLKEFDINKDLENMYKEINRTIQVENAKLNYDVMSNNAYNKSLQLPAIIDLSANFEGTVPVQLNLDGEKIYDNQQKISVRKSIQYGGVK